MLTLRRSRRIAMANGTVSELENQETTTPAFSSSQPLPKRQRAQIPPPVSTLPAASTSRSILSQPQQQDEEIEEEEDERRISNPVVCLDEPDLLDCPICTEPLRVPVFQCDNGHWACESCCKKIRNRCPSCSLPIGFNRNRAIERVVQSATTSCLNMVYGCPERVSYLKKPEHENTCNYVPISCAIQGCKCIVMPKCFYRHITQKHRLCYTPITLNTVTEFLMKRQNHVILRATDEKIDFVLRRVVDRSLGSFVNVCIAPTASDKRFSFDLTAKQGMCSVSLKTAVELTPKYFVEPDMRDCLFIPKDFHARDFNASRYPRLNLVIVIREVS